MKKILGLTTLLLCLLGTQTALADFTLSEPSNDLEVSVNCADMGNAGVSVSVFGDGASEVEPAFVYQTKGTADGAYLVDMQLSSNASGIYTVSVFDIAKKSYTQQTFFLSDSDTYRTKIGELNLLKDADAAVISEYIEQNKNELEFANPLYEAVNKTETARLLGERLKKGLFSEDDREGNRAIYKNLLAINGLWEKKLSGLDELALYAQLMREGGLKTWYDGIKSTAVKNEIFTMLNGKKFASIEAFENALIEAFVLKKVRYNDGWGEAKNIITQFEKQMNITASKYSDTAFSAVSGNSYDDYSELIAALDKKNGSAPAIKQPNKGSGGGGGGSSVPSVSIPAGMVQNQTVKPIEKAVFSDLEGVSWAVSHIEKLYHKNIVSGAGDGTFLPDKAVTREEFVKMIVVAFDMYNESAQAEFTDVPLDAWYYRYVASAVENGLVSGIGENLFGSGNRITRQDMAVIAYRAAIAAGKKLNTNAEEITFADASDISDYAKESVSVLSKNGIINGISGSFCPMEISTRAQAAVIISQLYDLE